MAGQSQQETKSAAPFIPGPGRPGGGAGRFRGPVVKPKNFKGTLRRLWVYFGRERKMLSIIFSFIVIDAALTLLAPYLIGKAVDAMHLHKGSVDFSILEMLIYILLGAYLFDALLTFLQGWLMAGVSQRIVKTLRSHLFQKLQKLPVAFFDTRTHGELMSRLSNDIDNVSSTVSQSTTQLMSGAITLVGSFIMMLVLSPILTVPV
jgi:ATP-binding cassette subfamily B protein